MGEWDDFEQALEGRMPEAKEVGVRPVSYKPMAGDVWGTRDYAEPKWKVVEVLASGDIVYERVYSKSTGRRDLQNFLSYVSKPGRDWVLLRRGTDGK